MPKLSHEQLARDARFVFHGTVQNASAREVTGGTAAKAVTVRVDEIVQGPAKLSTFQGHDVLVVLHKGERLANGEQAVFYTNGISFGDTLTLESIGHLPLRSGVASLRSAAHPAVMLKKQDVQKRLESADTVVVGTVTEVRLPAFEANSRRVAGTAVSRGPALRRPVSEHDPQWRDAVIEVDRVEKGRETRKQVLVRFPASDDVRWFQAPKFTPGEQGVFILHRQGTEVPTTRGLAARRLAAGEAEVFTALHPEDVQPPELGEEISMIVKSARATGRASAKPARDGRKAKKVRSVTAAKRRQS